MDGRPNVDRAWLESLVTRATARADGALDDVERLHRWVMVIAQACFRTIAPLLPPVVSVPLVPLLEDALVGATWTAERILEASAVLGAPEIEPIEDVPSEPIESLHNLAAVSGGTSSMQMFLLAIPKQARRGDTVIISTALGATAAYLVGAAVSTERLAGLDRELSLKALSDARSAIEAYRRELLPEQDEMLVAGSMALHTHPRQTDTQLPPVDVVKAHVVAMLRMAEWLLRRTSARSI